MTLPQDAKSKIGKCSKLILPVSAVVAENIPIHEDVCLPKCEAVIAELDISVEGSPRARLAKLGRLLERRDEEARKRHRCLTSKVTGLPRLYAAGPVD